MIDETNKEILEIFKETGALIEGHFILRSGLHSAHFFQCAKICQHLDKVSRLAEILIPNLKPYQATTIVGNAMGGLIMAQEVARQMSLRYVFLEKVSDNLELRRDFTFKENENVIIIEDVITKGGRVFEAIEILKSKNVNPVAIGTIVDRSNESVDFKIPHHSLMCLNFPTYKKESLPESLMSLPAVKPGS